MPRYVLRPRAVADLDNIWDYSVKIFGVDQAVSYIQGIQSAIETVALDPRRGRLRDDIRANYRSFGAGSHLIFYRTHSEEIEVVRILHQRMDLQRHL